MGANTGKIVIDANTEYNGEIQDNKPHRRGKLQLFKPDGQNGRKRIWEIEGQFQKGQLVRCRANNQEYQYVGDVKKGTLTGHGIICQGQFQDGVFIKGEYIKKGQYSCKGSFIEVESNKQCPSKKQNKNCKPKSTPSIGDLRQFNFQNPLHTLGGNFIRNQLSGQGKYKFQNEDQYNGNFEDGYFQNNGIYTSSKSSIKKIQGNFHKSLPHTPKNHKQIHLVQFINGDRYEGYFKLGKMHGQSITYTYNNGRVFRGSMCNNRMSGDCQIQYQINSPVSKYKGQILDGMLNGVGTLTYKNGLILKAYFTKNLKNGPCLYTHGQRMWKCLYVMDQLMENLVEVKKSQ